MNEPIHRDRLARVFSELPELEPPAGAWSKIEARLEAPPAGHRGRAAALAVVGLGAVAIALKLAGPPAVDAPPQATEAPASVAVDPLDARSSHLERLLAALPPQRATRASTGLATTLLEDRIALVDESLSHPAGAELPPETTAALKRERVVLLDSLVRVRYASAVIVSL